MIEIVVLEVVVDIDVSGPSGASSTICPLPSDADWIGLHFDGGIVAGFVSFGEIRPDPIADNIALRQVQEL